MREPVRLLFGVHNHQPIGNFPSVMADAVARAGIGARFSFIAGFPKEPKDSLRETYRTAKAIREIDGEFETPIYFYAPYPGTALAERMPALGFTAPRTLEDWEKVDLDHSIGPWISEPVRRNVPRYNYYLRALP